MVLCDCTETTISVPSVSVNTPPVNAVIYTVQVLVDKMVALLGPIPSHPTVSSLKRPSDALICILYPSIALFPSNAGVSQSMTTAVPELTALATFVAYGTVAKRIALIGEYPGLQP